MSVHSKDGNTWLTKLERIGELSVRDSKIVFNNLGSIINADMLKEQYRRVCDWHLYKERHLIECFIGKIKQFRRVFSRFDKLAGRFLSFIQLASTLI